MSSRSKKFTAQALEIIFNADSDMEEDVSEDEDNIELNSKSNDSDFEPEEGIDVPVPPSQTFISKNDEIKWSSSTTVCKKHKKVSARVPRMAVTRMTDIKSIFELVIPNCIKTIILEINNLKGGRVLGEMWKDLDQSRDACLGVSSF